MCPMAAHLLLRGLMALAMAFGPAAGFQPQTPGRKDRAAERPCAHEWFDRLQSWSASVEQHDPGVPDASVGRVAWWSAREVDEVVEDYLSLSAAWRRGDRTVRHRGCTLVADDLRSWPVFAGPGATAFNRVLRRAAMFHADVALLGPDDASTHAGRDATVMVLDGVVVGRSGLSAHWPAARRLLDAIVPSPQGDLFVAAWYNATTAALLLSGNLVGGKQHVEHALRLLPSDANLQFQSGYFHQVSVVPSLEAFVRQRAHELRDTARGRSQAGAVLLQLDEHRKAAERRFREAIRLDPSHHEARVRLGLALIQLGRLEDSVPYLRQAVSSSAGAELSYVAQMLLGQAEERLGRRTEAEACYEEAAALYPLARSPRFALAALLRSAGRTPEAWSIVENVTAPPVPEQIEADPWWTFDQWQATSDRVLLDAVRDMVRTERQP